MSKDRELDGWRERWSGVAEPRAAFKSELERRIKRHERRILLDNVVAAVALLGTVIGAWYVAQQSSWLGNGWATGICGLMFVSGASRIWVLRRSWRPQTRSTREFLEFRLRRVRARIWLLRNSGYLALGWIICCIALTAANWSSISRDLLTHPKDWLGALLACLIVIPFIGYWVLWMRRRTLVELSEIELILEDMGE